MLTVILLLSLAVPAVASAWTAPPADEAGRLARFLPIARAVWPQSPCAGKEVVHLNDDDDIARNAASMKLPASLIDAYARAETCEVFMSSGVNSTPEHFCEVLTHEFGHLAGYRDPLNVDDPLHSHVSTDVMGPSAGYWQPCDVAANGPLDNLMRLMIGDELPTPAHLWRIVCGKETRHQKYCRALPLSARAGHMTRRFLVTLNRVTRGIIVHQLK